MKGILQRDQKLRLKYMNQEKGNLERSCPFTLHYLLAPRTSPSGSHIEFCPNFRVIINSTKNRDIKVSKILSPKRQLPLPLTEVLFVNLFYNKKILY